MQVELSNEAVEHLTFLAHTKWSDASDVVAKVKAEVAEGPDFEQFNASRLHAALSEMARAKRVLEELTPAYKVLREG